MTEPMRKHNPKATRGIALIVALLLLVMLTILGVTSMSSVVMQERMAGNVNLQSIAFEAASAGVPESLRFADPGNWGVDDSGNPRICRRASGQWLADWTPFVNLEINDLPEGITVGYRQRLGCFEPDEAPEAWGEFDEVPLQLLVLNQGEVSRGDDVLARREVEVRVDRRGEADCLLTIGFIDPAGVNMGNSAKGAVDGGPGGCPIRTASPDAAQEMIAQLEGNGNNSRLGNYQPNPPGIHSAPLRGIWAADQAPNLARAMNAIKIGIRAWDIWYRNIEGVVDCDGLPIGLRPKCEAGTLPVDWATEPNPFQACRGLIYAGDFVGYPNEDYPDPDPDPDPDVVRPFIYYISGSLTTSGGGMLEGMQIIEGGLRFNGSPNYQGDLIILGGSLDVGGFGKAGNSGMLQLHNLIEKAPAFENSVRPVWVPAEDAEWGTSEVFNISGMGTASITADDCDDLQARWASLNACLDRIEFLVEGEDADPDFAIYKATIDDVGEGMLDVPDFGGEDDIVRFSIPRCGEDARPRDVIASWREYIDRQRWN